METFIRIIDLIVYAALCGVLWIVLWRMRILDQKLNMILAYQFETKKRREENYVSSGRGHGTDNETARENV